ncbi:MAG: HAMP domain-containing sensor histidine kinase [Oscillospiraceae bacterium]|nr:HAMP domain-containing sensor histidine kinase [Oscillospiraceae bacterium]
MKHHAKHLCLFFLFVALIFACFLLSAYAIGFLFGNGITFREAAIQSIGSLAGIIILMLLALIYKTAYHLGGNRRHKSYNESYHAFLNEIEEALDRISKGDFEIRIDKEKCEDARYHNEHISDLADKINNMAQELSGMETMRQDFVSNVSHEIQSPLTSIRGFVSLLKDETLSRDEQLHYIEVIESESLRLSKLGENLLRLSTLESESSEINPKTYSLSRQLKDVILCLEPQWSEKNMDISLNEGAVDITADEYLLSQVWINLLNNSIKFSSDGGKIAIVVSGDDTQIQVSISDSGIGMTEKTMTHIFERFYMADKSRGRNAGGSGLGLSIVKRIVQLHHGNIDVNSNPGEGTTFIISIPKNQSV